MRSSPSPTSPTKTSADRSPSDKLIRLAIVDDHPPIRDAIRREAEETIDLKVVDEAGSAEEASQLIEEQRPDVCIVDLSLRDGYGFDLIRSIQDRHPSIRLLVFSVHDEVVYAERALKAGADGYLMKGCSLDEILTAVRRVAVGEVYLSAEMAARVVRNVQGGEAEAIHFPVDELTDREREIFRMLGEGTSTETIADRLGVARKTVETHRRRVKEKLGYSTIDDVVAHAARWVLGTTTDRDSA